MISKDGFAKYSGKSGHHKWQIKVNSLHAFYRLGKTTSWFKVYFEVVKYIVILYYEIPSRMDDFKKNIIKSSFTNKRFHWPTWNSTLKQYKRKSDKTCIKYR